MQRRATLACRAIPRINPNRSPPAPDAPMMPGGRFFAESFGRGPMEPAAHVDVHHGKAREQVAVAHPSCTGPLQDR